VNTEPRYLPLTLLLALGGLALAAQARDDFPPPPDSRVEQVAGETSALGMQLAIRRFRSELKAEQVIDFYRKLWGEEAAVSEAPPWRMIGTVDDGHYLNVQVRDEADGSEGLLSESDLPERLTSGRYRPTPRHADFPRMSGSDLISVSDSRDAGKTGRLVQLQNDFSVASNASFYRRHYEGQGYTTVMDEAVAPREQGRVLYFQRGPHNVTVTINRVENRTSIIASDVSEGFLP